MLRIVEETCKVEELKDAKEKVKKEKCAEGEDKRIVAKRGKERDLAGASEADLDLDSSDDESEEEHGDMFHKLLDGQVNCAHLN